MVLIDTYTSFETRTDDYEHGWTITWIEFHVNVYRNEGKIWRLKWRSMAAAMGGAMAARKFSIITNRPWQQPWEELERSLILSENQVFAL